MGPLIFGPKRYVDPAINLKEIQDVNLFTIVEDGVLDIELQPTSLYDGTAQGLIRVDNRGSDVKVETQLILNQLSVSEFAPAISRLNTVTGQLDVEANYSEQDQLRMNY